MERERTILHEYFVFCGLSIFMLSQSPALAQIQEMRVPEWSLGFEQQLYRNSISPSFFPILSAGVKWSPQFESFEDARLSGQVRISPLHPKAHALLLEELYVGDSDLSYDSDLKITFGRKKIGWSNMDEMWGLGNIEPLNSWDRLRPQTQGLTGIFAYTETTSFQVRFFYSFLTFPEVTPNIVLEDENFARVHPQSPTSPAQSVKILNQSAPLRYQIQTPRLDRILIRQSLLFSIETKKEYPLFAKFVYGSLPLNYFPLSLDASLSLLSGQVPVVLRPRLLSHQVTVMEVGYRASDRWKVGLNTFLQDIKEETIDSNLTASLLGDSTTLSPYVQFQASGIDFTFSHLLLLQGDFTDVGLLKDSFRVSSHQFYRNASLLKLSKRFILNNTHLDIQARYTREHRIAGDWIACDAFYPLNEKTQIFFGGDLLASQKDQAPERGAEFIADLRAMDRIRIGVQYVF